MKPLVSGIPAKPSIKMLKHIVRNLFSTKRPDIFSIEKFEDSLPLITVKIINIPDIASGNIKYIRVNPTTEHNKKEIDHRHKLLTAAGYEGTIVRIDCKNGYECGKRSFSLFKKKDFCQEEYECIGFQQKKVSSTETLGSCLLRDSQGREFKATPCMTDEQKKHIWENQEKYFKLIATVKFFEKSSKGIPRHPNIIGFRHPDDMGKGE